MNIRLAYILFVSFLFTSTQLLVEASSGSKWWDKAWSGRKPLTIDTSAEGGAIPDTIKNSVVLLRLHQGNFPFEAAQKGGVDLRVLNPDGLQIPPFHVEKWDSLMLEGIVWI